jgi:HAE1 family hydrophobic/amphiphilic exporter-1
MHGLITVAVQRRVSVLMFALAVIAFGVVGYQRLAVDLFPDIAHPSLTIQTNLPDAAPQEVETMITRPIEEAAGVLRGLERIHSVSRSGVSEVTMEFAWGSDMAGLAMDVREKLDRVILPEGAEDPIVLRFDPSLDPIVRLAVVGPPPLTAVRDIAERKLKPAFETVPGVASAQVRGGLEEEIRVEIDQERLAALRLPLDEVRAAVAAANVNVPGGALKGRDQEFLVRTVNEFDSVEELADLIIREENGRAVRLKDVATVHRGTKEREEITRVDGEESVELALFKEGDANTVSAARALDERLEEWRKKLPEGYRITVLFDQSRFIEQSIEEVRDATLIGGALAVLVLLFFLRDLKSTLIIATAIPLSVLATFMVMYQAGISLNIMSLGGLTLGIGMVVDNAIVVLESIHRKRQEGLHLAKAAIQGAAEVAAAVTASTLTSVAVFLPIVFVEGVAGQLFRDQALTVAISLLASLAVAVTLIPTLSAQGRDRGVKASAEAEGGAPLGRASGLYDALVRGAVRHRVLTVMLAILLFGASVVAGTRLKTELIPPLTSGEFFFELKLPEGTSLAATDRAVARMEAAVAAEAGIAQHHATVGRRQAAGGLSVGTQAENLAQLDVVLADRTHPEVEAQVADDLRRRFAQLPDAQVRLGRPSYFTLETPVEVALYADDLEQLRDTSITLAEALAARPGFVDVRSSLEAGNPEVQVIFDRRRVAALGLDIASLSTTLSQRVQGVVPTRFKEADRQIDVRVLNEASSRATLEDVRRLVVPGPDGSNLRLLALADVLPARGPAEIHRLQQQRAALVTANLEGLSLGSAILEVERVLGATALPTGMTAEIGGQNREMQVSFQSLQFAVLLAIFLVYLVMASTFESLIHPFIVLLTIPLAAIGVVAGLLATRTTVTVIVLIGAVMLVGIVVNNAIVLIDTINRLRREGIEKLEAVVRAGHVRLRPILMTTLTTTLALIPMALGLGEGGELRAPLAITVGSGLVLSTLLTLVVIPAVYALIPSQIAPEDPEDAP